jgi:hypothetical protein
VWCLPTIWHAPCFRNHSIQAYAYAFTATGCSRGGAKQPAAFDTSTTNTTIGVADSAFDWDGGVRRTDEQLVGLAVTLDDDWN